MGIFLNMKKEKSNTLLLERIPRQFHNLSFKETALVTNSNLKSILASIVMLKDVLAMLLDSDNNFKTNVNNYFIFYLRLVTATAYRDSPSATVTHRYLTVQYRYITVP